MTSNDLVKRLRAKCKLLHQCVEMRREAADEIERLRAVVEQIAEMPTGEADDAVEMKAIALATLEDDDE